MKAFVFTDKALESEAGRFVWLEMNTERPENSAFRKQYRVEALPTYYIVDPAEERVLLKRVGGATVPQLLAILEAGRASHAAAPGTGGTASTALARAEDLYGNGDYAGAILAYREALAAAPRQWPPYERAVESFLFALQRVGEYENAAKTALEAHANLDRSPAAAGIVTVGLDCALELPGEHLSRSELLAALETRGAQIAGDLTLPVAADDRSTLYGSLLAAREDAKDEAGARDVAGRWAAYLEAESARASTPEGRAVFDPHRLSAYLALGEPERAIAMLQASERDLPDDYNPPARLAVALMRLERWDEALGAVDRALTKAYGPRKLRILQTRADILAGKADMTGARATLADAVALAESLPEGQRSEATIAALKRKLESLGGAGGSGGP